MKTIHQIFTFLLSIIINCCYGQSFINGDLDGVVNGLSCLPTNWQNVPFDDINCLGAQIGNDTPDLTNLNGPSIPDGACGIAFSGSTFISGIYAKSLPNFFQEGIMQQVSGFTLGQVYRINLRQSVVKGISAIDKSGSWAVYIDTILAGVTSPSYSDEPYNSINLLWEARSINYTATASSHLIKFLPMDDDSNWFFSNNDTTGALYMGIDSINIMEVTGMGENNINDGFKVFPNPVNDLIVINMPNNFDGTIKIVDPIGKEIYICRAEKITSHFSIDLSKFQSGFYFVTFSDDHIFVTKKIVKE
jgi:hypothetical protein